MWRPSREITRSGLEKNEMSLGKTTFLGTNISSKSSNLLKNIEDVPFPKVPGTPNNQF